MIVLVSLLILPWLLWKIVTVKNRRTAFLERMGLKGLPRKREERPFWIHTVSVGEVLATVPFVRKLKRMCPGLPILISSITPDGRAAAKREFGAEARIGCFPFDYPIPVWLALRSVQPRFFLHTETEIWPYFLLMLGRKGIPTAIVNGRISARSCRRYGWFRFFVRDVLLSVHVFAMQTRTDCLRIIRIGADPRRVYLTGNMKFDLPPPENPDGKRRAFRESMGMGEDSLLFVAGSTHRGEEEVLLSVYAKLKRETPGLKLLLAPRHPERCGELYRMCEQAGVTTERRTRRRAQGGNGDNVEVLVLDTMGELADIYAAADLVFVGGSLVPIGGHNPLEPILYKKPVLFGPYTEKIADTVDRLLDVAGGIRVGDGEELLEEAGRLIRDPGYREEVGRAAYGILAGHRGATERNLAILRPFLYPVEVDQNRGMA